MRYSFEKIISTPIDFPIFSRFGQSPKRDDSRLTGGQAPIRNEVWAAALEKGAFRVEFGKKLPKSAK